MNALTIGPESPRTRLTRLVQRARSCGRAVLFEHEGLEMAQALGLRVPRHVFVADVAEARAVDWAALGDGHVVVKIVSPLVQHKTDIGGVATVRCERDAIVRAVQDMLRRAASFEPVGCLVCEFIEHERGLGNELLLGARWSAGFGPIVTLGLGGIDVELLAGATSTGRSVAIFSPMLASRSHLARTLRATWWAPLVSGPGRSQAPQKTEGSLLDVVQRFLRFAAASMPHDLVEFEVNPLVFADGDPVALDVLASTGTGPASGVVGRPISKLTNLLHPASIAIIGVSTQMNPGRIILKNILDAGFDPRRVRVIKPGHDRIEACLCVPRLRDLRARVDLLVVCVDAKQLPDIVTECVQRRLAESLILIPGGLGEHEASVSTAARVRAIVRESRFTEWEGPVLNGGNCLGIRSVPGQYNTFFIPNHKLHFRDGPADPVALISQSGAFAVARSTRLPWLNPRFVITFGNQTDLTLGDYLRGLKDDPHLEVFACYVEGFAPLDGHEWLAAAEEITASGRPVILYQAGRTREGARAAASHTASVAGDYAVARALALQAGVLVADTVDDFDDLLRLAYLLRDKRVAGRRLGALSNAGFECVAQADRARGFSLPRFAPGTQQRLASLLRESKLDGIATLRNPLDVTPIADDARFEAAARAVCNDGNVDVAVVGCVPITGALQTLVGSCEHEEDVERPDSVANRLVRLHEESDKAWIAVVDGGAAFDGMARLLERRGVPTFRTTDRALLAFAKYCAWRCELNCRGRA